MASTQIVVSAWVITGLLFISDVHAVRCETMNRRERRILKAIAYHQARLDRLDYRNYRREADYWRVVTYHINRIRGLSKLLRTGAQETSPCLVIAHKL